MKGKQDNPRTVHGVLLDVHGVGVLITGKSGVGKSETALELIKRGHRLISDDLVNVRADDGKVTGSPPDIIKHLMGIRGLGIIDIGRLFGLTAVSPEKEIELVVELEEWVKKKDYDLLGDERLYSEILGVKIPKKVIPVAPGRNLAVITEAAALNFRCASAGFDVIEELNERSRGGSGT